MSRPVVFVDTNCVDNKSSATTFLGNRLELEKLAKRAKIILPKVVRDEVARHVYKYLRAQLRTFKSNPHRHLLKIEDAHIDALDLDLICANLEKNETIVFETLDLSNKSAVYEEIYNHAIEGTPPFEPNGDKGFKDALIAKTIDEYVARGTGETIFLMTKDEKLTEYFSDNDAVTVVKTYTDFDNEYSLDKFNQTMVDRALDFLSIEERDVIDGTLKEHWLNWDDELIGSFETGNTVYYIRIDSQHREPIGYINEDLAAYIQALEDTSNFKSAHENISTLEESINFFNESQILQIYDTFRNNDQIYSIGEDTDIQQAAQNLITALEGFALHREADAIRDQYRLNESMIEPEEAYLADMEAAAEAWIEMQGDIARGK